MGRSVCGGRRLEPGDGDVGDGRDRTHRRDGPTGRAAGERRFRQASTRPAASVRARNASEINNVVVFLKDAPRAASLSGLAAARVQMRQEDEAFVPRVVAITRGSTVDFPNADPFFHNVFSLSRGATFDLGRYPRGETRVRTFSQPGLVKVYCHIHSHMTASIMVFDHPYFRFPEADGGFRHRRRAGGRATSSAPGTSGSARAPSRSGSSRADGARRIRAADGEQ